MQVPQQALEEVAEEVPGFLEQVLMDVPEQLPEHFADTLCLSSDPLHCQYADMTCVVTLGCSCVSACYHACALAWVTPTCRHA